MRYAWARRRPAESGLDATDHRVELQNWQRESIGEVARNAMPKGAMARSTSLAWNDRDHGATSFALRWQLAGLAIRSSLGATRAKDGTGTGLW